MTNFAYLRVSTSEQDTANQKLSVLDYCNRNKMNNVQYVSDTSSGRKSWQSRPIGDILGRAVAGDNIIAAVKYQD